MNKIFSLLEFFAVLFFLVLPPLFATKTAGGTTLDFSHGYAAATFFLFAVSVFLYLIEKKFANKTEKTAAILKISCGNICLGLIFLVSAAFQTAGFLIEKSGFNFLENDKIIFPQNIFYFMNFITGTFCAAFYEEILYRFYFPESCKRNFKILTFGKLDSQKSKKTDFILELASALIFAFSHLYLGFLAVLNAFFSGIVLRICMRKTKSVFVPAFIHSVYNFSVFAALYFTAI